MYESSYENNISLDVVIIDSPKKVVLSASNQASSDAHRNLLKGPVIVYNLVQGQSRNKLDTKLVFVSLSKLDH
jgi:hypothetical protein